MLTCEFYWTPCLDRFHQINEYLEQNTKKTRRNNKKKSDVQVYFFDLQLNNLYHREFWSNLKYGYDLFGIFYIDPKTVRRWNVGLEQSTDYGRPLDESDKVFGNLDEKNLLDRYITFTMSNFDYFVKLYETMETSWGRCIMEAPNIK